MTSEKQTFIDTDNILLKIVLLILHNAIYSGVRNAYSFIILTH